MERKTDDEFIKEINRHRGEIVTITTAWKTYSGRLNGFKDQFVELEYNNGNWESDLLILFNNIHSVTFGGK